jgi:hypothetical protein
MKNLSFLGILVAVIAVLFVLSNYREPFVPEFLDQGNVIATSKTRTSSYTQDTNHFKMQPYPQPPIQGVETPFRVNMFDSYVP